MNPLGDRPFKATRAGVGSPTIETQPSSTDRMRATIRGIASEVAPAPAYRSPPLRDVWYYALPGFRLKRGQMVAKTLLGEALLLGRDAAGEPFALRDVCPHPRMPRSCRRV